MKLRTVPLLLLPALSACSEDGRTAVGAQLLVPDQLRVEWDTRFNEPDDQIGVLLPVDLMVFEGGTGQPLDLIRLDVRVDAGATPLDVDAVAHVGADCPSCVWDAGRDRYLQLDERAPSARSAAVLTDADGLARIYLWIDAFPTADGALRPLSVDVDTEIDGATFDIIGH